LSAHGTGRIRTVRDERAAIRSRRSTGASSGAVSSSGVRPLRSRRCGVPKLASCLQIANFSGRAPSFDTPHARAALEDAIWDEPDWAGLLYVKPVDLDEREVSVN